MTADPSFRYRGIYRFGAFELDAFRLELRRAGTLLELEPKPIEVLLELVRHAGEIVSKEELMDSVWGGRPLTDHVLTRCISKLRSVLDDGDQSLIVSAYGQGYRFKAAVAFTEIAPAHTHGMLQLSADEMVPLRPHWRLARPLDADRTVWLAQHDRTNEPRVFKFALRPDQIPSLRRELVVHRLLKASIQGDGDFVRLLDFNVETIPYFIELDWSPFGSLTDWAGSRGGISAVPLEERLSLITRAAESLAKAHAVGVLHLDVKPANLLVYPGPNGSVDVRWADFGSGKLLSVERLQELGITRLGTRTQAAADSGTLMYLAPETIAGQPPSTLADVFALGITLYQAVVGDFNRPLAVGWEHDIGDALLREDIALAVAGNPERRMSSALELARRLRALPDRRAQREREQAAAESATRTAHRLARLRAQRPWWIAALIVLLAGSGPIAWSNLAIRRARDAASREAAKSEAVIQFLEDDILSLDSGFGVGDQGPGSITVNDAVQRARQRIAGRFPDHPDVEESIRATIGSILVENGDTRGATEELQQAMQLGERQSGGADARTLRAEYWLAYALGSQMQFEPMRQVLDRADRALDLHVTTDPEVRRLRDIMNGNYYTMLEQYAAAAPYFERALDETRSLHPQDVSQVVLRASILGTTYAALGHFDRAFPLLDDALATTRRAEPRAGSLTGTMEHRYGIALFFAGRYDEAAIMLQSAYEVLTATQGSALLAGDALSFLGWSLLMKGDLGRAHSTLVQAVHLQQTSGGGPRHSATYRAQACLGMVELALGDDEGGFKDLDQAVHGLEQNLGPHAPEPQLFRFRALEARIRAGRAPPNATAELATFDAKWMSPAQPSIAWQQQLDALKHLISPAPTHPAEREPGGARSTFVRVEPLVP